jgi:hypothetical protein
MTGRDRNLGIGASPVAVNPGYAGFQIAKALTTSQEHADEATRERARSKISKWEAVLRNILTGSVAYGSRTPLGGVPAWATLEVVTGGFATGHLLAAGPLQEHERALLEDLRGVPEGEERRVLNAHFLTDAGLTELRERLRTGHYDVGVPEESALMVVAWLVTNSYAEEARALLQEISPYLTKLRFYPIPLERPRRFGSRAHLQNVGSTIGDLQRIEPNPRILAQKEAVEIWAPLYDRIVALFLETVEDGRPCQNYPVRWSERAMALLGEYAELRREHTLCGKPERLQGHFAQLRAFLARCARNPESLTGQEVGRIQHILNRYIEKRGVPASLQCEAVRRRQRGDVRGPTHHALAAAVIARLEEHPRDDGLDDISHLEQPVNEEESATSGIPAGTLIPPSIQHKVARCLNETVPVLVERGLITSGETLARVLPQMIAGLRAAGIRDPELRQLYTAIYRSFRRRRSLLLLNLEHQVQLEELPWVAAIDRFRSEDLSSRELARQALEELALLTISAFPHAILPNKLLQELRALAKGAGLDFPLVDEVAADIFMGQFTRKFLEAAKLAADLLDDSLYATYYDIDYDEVRAIPETADAGKPTWFWRANRATQDGFVELCGSRAGVALGGWDPATNGMIIEQQQILTTQNLAALITSLDLTEPLRGHLGELARQCFRWVCRRQRMKIDRWHAHLIMLKNTAYAWRQMVFFLSLLSEREVADLLRWAEEHLGAQPEGFQNRFRPALKGLLLASQGLSLASEAGRRVGARRFLGWSKETHWLMADIRDQQRSPDRGTSS